MELDFKNVKKAHIRFRGKLAGTLEKTSEINYRFQYNKKYLKESSIEIATSFPLSENPYESNRLHPFFDNIIVEGWLAQHTEKVLHIEKSNRFSLLMVTGQNTIGAVTVHPLDKNENEINTNDLFQHKLRRDGLKPHPNKPIENFDRCPSCFKNISGIIHNTCKEKMWGTLKNLSIELNPDDPEGSFSRVIHGGSISGAQRKGMFCLDLSKGRLVPTPFESQYILKPKGNRPELPENEHVTMAIAKKIGFEVPPFSLLNIDNVGFVFAIKRFDRWKNNPLRMEDMCQINKTPSESKYESSCEKVAKSIKKFSLAPKVDLTEFYRRIIFCYFIGNGDMHLKNWALLESQKLEGRLMLSPCYDFLNTRLPMPGEREDIGLSLNGKKGNFQRSYFQKFGEKLELTEKAIQAPFSSLNQWWKVTEGFVNHCLLSKKSKEKYLEIVHQRYKSLES